LRKSRGSLFIVSAPSGAGKTTLCRQLVKTLPNLGFSVSFTTRRPRPGEVNNRDYTFISREEFRSKADQGEFIEWAEVHGELYGTSKKRVEELLAEGNDVILDIDTQGAMQIKRKHEDDIYIFVLPPSLRILRKRLETRMTDSEQEIDRRFKRATDEIKTYREYDYVIMNDNLDDAVREFEAIIISQRLSIRRIEQRWIEEIFFKQEEH
jgi:guanylate kinase